MMKLNVGAASLLRTMCLAVAVLGLVLTTAAPAKANAAGGCVYCDVNQNGMLDGEDAPLTNVLVEVTNASESFYQSRYTDATGCFYMSLPLSPPDLYTETLEESTLPPDATYVDPLFGQVLISTDPFYGGMYDWLIDSATCRPVTEEKCWLTAGGVKFSVVTGELMAGVRTKGPEDSVGGNVYPGCNEDSGDGGNWNHIDHAGNKNSLHFQGTDITVLECGNVEGIEPGSESPVTPFNYIEFEGTGTLKGIGGNSADFGQVCFFAHVEDRNEPGNESALLPDGGDDVDRYFINVYDCGSGDSLLLIDNDGDPTTVDPITITGGNFQIHISSCSN